MSKDFKNVVKELNKFYAEETKEFNNHVVIYPFT